MTEQLKCFVEQVTRALERSPAEEALLPIVEASMSRLVENPAWLPQDFARPATSSYRQYLLYCDPLERFSVVSFVWGPGQRTPVHNHTVWGVIGQLIGREQSQSFVMDDTDRLQPVGEPETTLPGRIITVSPRSTDIHTVSNPSMSEVAISIHAYGGNIGRVERNVFDVASGKSSPFISSYSNDLLPNIWR